MSDFQETTSSPSENTLQLTVRSVLVGSAVGAMVTVMNVYVGLKIGFSFGGSVVAAILSFALFQLIKPKQPFGKLENNIAQTAGSAAGSMASAAGFLAPIPAMKMLGMDISITGLYLWTFSSAFLGVMMAVPLRRQYVEVEKLKFPTGLATANTLNALHTDSNEGMLKARALLFAGTGAFIFALITHFFPQVEHPDLTKISDTTWLTTISAWGFGLLISPVMFGVGMLVGPRIGNSLMLGAIVGAIIGMNVQELGWAPQSPMTLHNPETDEWGPRGWILWIGAALMVSEALTSLALSAGTFVRSFQSAKQAIENRGNVKSQDEVPARWWISGLIASAVIVIVVMVFYFQMPWYLTLIAILLSIILANVATRSTGETDITPVGGMGKVTQLVFGSLSSSVTTNLMAAGITGAGASQSADIMQDLRTGHLLGASPKKQFIAQLWGIAAGALVAPLVFIAFDYAYDIGGEGSVLPGPAAQAWKAVAQVMSRGLDALPPHVAEYAIWALIIGAIPAIVRKIAPKVAAWTPSMMACGIAMMIPGYYSFIILLGGLFVFFWRKRNESSAERWVYAIASGFLVGEGIASVVKAIMSIFNIG